MCIFPSDGIGRIRFTGLGYISHSQPNASGSPKTILCCDQEYYNEKYPKVKIDNLGFIQLQTHQGGHRHPMSFRGPSGPWESPGINLPSCIYLDEWGNSYQEIATVALLPRNDTVFDALSH